MRGGTIDTDLFSARLRARAVDVQRERLLLARLTGSEQEDDLSEPVNCSGVGRIRHFRRETSMGWPSNSLPIDPASAALRLEPADELRAQLFQDAVCNWRCWYCYVPYQLLEGNNTNGTWMRPSELVQAYLGEANRPDVIVLSGGQPDLIPEWTPWMMKALEARGVADSTYIWVDDNLSNDYFWRHLTQADIDLVSSWPMFGRVGCFKGFDYESFTFNTKADPKLFDHQFQLFKRHLQLGVDCYAYVTLTGPDLDAVVDSMPRFIDRLQSVHELLPLRTVPLEVKLWGPVHARMNPRRVLALEVQQRAIESWNLELEHRFSKEQRGLPIHLVRLRTDRGI